MAFPRLQRFLSHITVAMYEYNCRAARRAFTLLVSITLRVALPVIVGLELLKVSTTGSLTYFVSHVMFLTCIDRV